VIEKFKPEYTRDIINICYRTGFYGGDLSRKKIFGDKKLFAMRFVLHYTRFQPEYCFVYKTDGNVVGYIVGTDNTKKQEIDFLETMYPKIRRRMYLFTRWYSFNSFHRMKGFLMSDSEPEEDDTIAEMYPAHLHMNVLPGFQSRGIGQQLLNAFIAAMRNKGIPGIHLGTSSANTKAVPFYEKNKFILLKEYESDMWNTGSGYKSLIYVLKLQQ
jgi:ribosomal protein S18 acetylase RimI-like enzyme